VANFAEEKKERGLDRKGSWGRCIHVGLLFKSVLCFRIRNDLHWLGSPGSDP